MKPIERRMPGLAGIKERLDAVELENLWRAWCPKQQIDRQQREPTRETLFWAQLDALARLHHVCVREYNAGAWGFDFEDANPGLYEED